MRIKKILMILTAIILLSCMFMLNVHAADAYTIPGANNAPVMDGKLDDSYMKLHDFYACENYKTIGDEDKSIKGAVYMTYDANNVYVFIEANVPINDAYAEDALSMGEFVCAYIAILGTVPGGGYTDDSRFEIGIALGNDGSQLWKTCSPGDIRDSSAQKAVFTEAPFKFFVARDEAAKKNFYEFAVPWTFVDRSGTFSYKEGSQITFNCLANIHVREDYKSSGQPHFYEYGGGIWNGGYEDGGIITLGAYPIIEIIIDEVPGGEEEAEVATVPPVKPASPQTSDTIALFAVLAIASMAVLVSKKRRA